MRLAVPAKQRSMTSSFKPDRLEDLCALVGLQRRDAHLGHHLEHALGDALAIGVSTTSSSLGNSCGVQQAVAARLPERLERQVRIDRIGAVADQQAVMMHLAGFARFDDDADPRPLGLAHQVMMHGAARQQRAERHAVAADSRGRTA